MVVTLDVSKLSGWLNFVPCQVESGSMARGGGGMQSRGAGRGHAQGAHGNHVVHGRDAGRVEVQRLVERRGALPSQKERIRAEVRAGGGWRGTVWWRKRGHAWGEGPTIKAGIGHARGAHSEHALHVCDFGRVNEAQWLVEGRRGLPSRQRGQNIRGEVGGGRTWGSGGAQWGGLIGVRGAGVRGGWGAGRGRSALRTCSACL